MRNNKGNKLRIKLLKKIRLKHENKDDKYIEEENYIQEDGCYNEPEKYKPYK